MRTSGRIGRSLLAALILVAPAVLAERAPVLKQIAVPHDYYFREMYLPQTTTGPGSPAFFPDGSSLVYSMSGSLWRQAIGEDRAVELTAGPGYDYQPDVSPDGGRIVFVRYLGDAMELHVLDLETGETTQLTREGAVNLEPRWSPEGSRIAFVSTRDTGRFRLFVGEIDEQRLTAAPLFDERESAIERYYYSSYDHQISPSWSPDGEELLYVGNPETPYGTGDIWRYRIDGASEPRLVRREETSWRARPDWSPDGKRYIYASYLGRQWHQLWGGAIKGAGEPFPLTYGEHDVASPRWSPDASRIAYTSNESGNTTLQVQDTVGGRVVDVVPEERVYLRPMGELSLSIVDQRTSPAPARVSVIAEDGRAYAPESAWMHADDGFDREHARFEARYFHTGGRATITLPPGPARVLVWHGLEHETERRLVTVRPGETSELTVRLEPLDLPEAWRNLASGDVHVHMNYGGTYRNTPEQLVRQAQAEDLDLVFNLIVNKEQRVPDAAYFTTAPDTASNDEAVLLHAQEFHTSYWGHMGLLGLDDHYLMPDYSAYPGTWAASLYPDNATVADLAHAQGAAVGYVHPFLAPPPDPATDDSLTNALPVDVALGKVDYYEVVGFADHHASAAVWYRLLNLGFRLAAAGGTDAMANYASLRGPVGINRTYVSVPETEEPAARRDAWLAGLKAGHTFATNAPLLGFSLDGRAPGETVDLDDGQELTFRGFMRSMVPMDHLEVVYNGDVVRRLELTGDRRSADFEGSVRIDGSGWLLLRAWNDGSHPMVFDLYPYGTTTPVYLTVGGKPPRSAADADYFIAWIERIHESARNHPDYNNEAERSAVLSHLAAARRVLEQRRE